MGSLFSAFDIGRSGLQVAQVQLDVTSNNIANVNKRGYSRQRVELAARMPVTLTFGQLGRGVQVKRVTRLRDDFLDTALRRQVRGLGQSDVEARAYRLAEDLFLEPTPQGFSTRLARFFDAASDFAHSVESIPARQSLISEAEGLADQFNQISNQLNNLKTDANEQVRSYVTEINGIAERIADLNHQIRTSEVRQTVANELRDERDLELDRLARIANINVFERDGGGVDVFIGNTEIVSSTGARSLVAVQNPTLDPERPDLFEVRTVERNQLADIQSGELFGALQVRDSIITGIDSRLDQLAAGLIEQVNRVQTQGNGLENLSDPIESSNAVNDADAALSAAGLPFSVADGSFDVVVYDSTGTPTTSTIAITATTTLNDIIGQLDALAGVSATLTPELTLRVSADPGFGFSFANDSARVLTALGLNGFFQGRDARTIRINGDLESNPALLTSAFSTNINDTGDNTAALEFVNIANIKFLDGGVSTLGAFYQNTVTQLGVDARTTYQSFEAEQTFVDNFESRRQEVSGVNIDEEVTFLLQFQRAFEAASRVITTTDRMLETLLNVGA